MDDAQTALMTASLGAAASSGALTAALRFSLALADPAQRAQVSAALSADTEALGGLLVLVAEEASAAALVPSGDDLADDPDEAPVSWGTRAEQIRGLVGRLDGATKALGIGRPLTPSTMRFLIALALLTGCTPDAPAGTAEDPPPTEARSPLSADSLAGTFEGYYSAGFEHTGFRPCADTSEVWWTEPATTVTPLADNQARVDWSPAADVGAFYQQTAHPSATDVTGPAVWARLRGRATPRDSAGYGHLGQYTRAFAVDSVEAMRLEAPPGACAPPRSVRP